MMNKNKELYDGTGSIVNPTKTPINEVKTQVDFEAVGRKDDTGKIHAGIIHQDFPNALAMIGEVASHGANKYTRHGWKEVPNKFNRYYDAFYRHMNAYNQGELIDPEFGLPHLAHAAWNILAILEIENEDQGT